MGFAVIPIIFTIAEDSFSSVPAHLTAASLALGASRWQTATRVVLPTASPGVFSAIMVGFGRAVGETMIVLMATGNTPVMDWSIFNGMRTLSANIAVEIPEAPHGGTLYRVLFLAAGLLFFLTFVVNTVAEIVRQRLRERYRALVTQVRPEHVLPIHRKRPPTTDRTQASLRPSAPPGSRAGAAESPASTLWRRGDPMIWFTGKRPGHLPADDRGASCWWSSPTVSSTSGLVLSSFSRLRDGSRCSVRWWHARSFPTPSRPRKPVRHRIQLRLGNRDLLPADFRWVDEAEVVSRERPVDGAFRRTPRVRSPDRNRRRASRSGARTSCGAPEPMAEALIAGQPQAAADSRRVLSVEKDDIGDLNNDIAKATPRPEGARSQGWRGAEVTEQKARVEAELAALEARFREKEGGAWCPRETRWVKRASPS